MGFLAFVLASVLLATLVHRQAARWNERTAIESLRASVDLRAHGTNLWLAERFADAEAASGNGALQHVLRDVFAEGAQNAGSRKDLKATLDGIQHRYRYASVSLVDAQSLTPILSSDLAPTRADIERSASASLTARAVWVDLLPQRGPNEYRAAVVRRFASDGPLSRVVLVLEVDPLQLLQTLSYADRGTLDGQTTLVRVRGRSVAHIATYRSATGQALASLNSVSPDTIEHRLVNGPSDLGRGKGSDGKEAVAVRKPLQLPGWYLVGVLNESDVFAELRQRTVVASAAYGLLALVVAASLLLWVRAEGLRHQRREGEMADFYDKILRQGDGLFVLNDWRGTVVDVSMSSVHAFGRQRESLIGTDVMELAPVHERPGIVAMVRNMQVGDSRQFTGERLRADGTTFFVEGSVGLLEIRGRRYFHSVARDVTQARALQARLQQAASVFELAPAAIVVCDSNFTVVSVNPAFRQVTGFAPEEVIGKPVRDLTTGAEPARTAEILAHMQRHDHWQGELPGRRKNGQVYPRHMSVATQRDAKGQPYQYIGMFTDLSMLQQARTEADYHANHDQLTRLPNRRRLDVVLPALVREASDRGRSLTVAMFNVDRFKSINESFGLAEGDKLLVEVARRLESGLPPGRLFRFGADEFVALLDGPPVGHALTIDKTLSLVCAKLSVGTHALVPSASVGMASYPELAQDPDMLLTNACAALTIAKGRGGMTWQLYEPAMNASAYDDMLLAVELRSALDEQALELYFQPQACIGNWSIVGMEALLRWNHPTRGMVPPSRFIPIAEASGLIIELGRWVLQEACRLWAVWRDAGLLPPSVAVNISALQFSHPDFLDEVQTTMERYGIAPSSLVLELTESLIMDDSEAAVGTMKRLVAMGVRLALDDFGTGYSSLSYLTRFPLEKLKIDRSFISPIGSSRGCEGEAIVKSVLSMANALQLRVVAEGVETEEQAHFLKLHGCDEMQGYLYAKPMAAPLLRDLLEATLSLRSVSPPSGLAPVVGNI
jgi:diguanylate cyclase (GGDEF)-like protein/PAS domain S-box-containing protein